MDVGQLLGELLEAAHGEQRRRRAVGVIADVALHRSEKRRHYSPQQHIDLKNITTRFCG